MAGHFWNFIHTAWEMLRNALSTSNLSLTVFSLCIPFAVFVVAVIVKWSEARSWNGLVQSLKASVKPVLIGAGITVVAWVCLFSWALYKSVYNDHQNLVGRLHVVVNEKDALKTTLKQRDGYIKRLEQSQLRVVTRTLPAPELEKECWEGVYIYDPKTEIKDAMGATSIIFHCNYKLEAPYAVDAKFELPILRGFVWIPGASMIGGQVTTEKEYGAQISSPSLPANHLVILTVFTKTSGSAGPVSANIQELK
jgi:hypothetical protein